MIGTAYGVILNDRIQLAELDDALHVAPYGVPPRAAVLYIKPRGTFGLAGATVPLPSDIERVTIAPTIALVIGEDHSIAGARLAIDVSEPHDNFHRPAVRERCRDGFLPLGEASTFPGDAAIIVTAINGVEAHRWSLDRLVRKSAALIADITGFMSLSPGDLLLLGLPGDAPTATHGDRVVVRCDGLPPLATEIVAEAA